MLFQNRSAAYDPRLSAIAGHLRAIEKELGGIGNRASRSASAASAGAVAASNQVADAIGPILNDIVDRFRRGQRAAVDEAASFGTDAYRIGSRVGNDALDRLTTQAKDRPLMTLAVAIGIGILIGAVSRRG